MAKTKKAFLFGDRLKRFDLFSDKFSFVIKGRRKIKTHTGSFCSVFLAMFVIFYSH